MNLFKPFEQHTRLWITMLIIISALLGAGGADRASRIVSYICVGCTDCRKICPVKAITMINGKAVVDQEKCIGCGQCVFACSFSAIRTEEK